MKVLIVGAGLAGLGIGWRLAQAGVKVTVLERAQPVSGASWAAAGMIAVTAEFADAPPPELAFARYSNDLWPSFAVELEEISGRHIGYRRNGALMIARDDRARAALEIRAGEPGLFWLDATAARAKAPMLTGEFVGALWAPDEAQVDNRALGVALAVAFLRAGGKLVPNETVIGFERRPDRHATVARTAFGLYEADALVLAAGAWSGIIETQIPIVPVKGEMIALTPPAGQKPPGPVIWGHGVYAVPRQERLLIGATVEEAGFDTCLTLHARTSLRTAAEALLPGLRSWILTDQWAGLRPRSPDGLPVLGPAWGDGIFVAGGQFRNGVLLTPAIAEHMRDLLLGRAAVIAAFDPRRFAA